MNTFSAHSLLGIKQRAGPMWILFFEIYRPAWKRAGELPGACADRGKPVGLREVPPEKVTYLGLRVE